MSDIATELSASGTNISLRALSSTAGFTTPDAVSEFYGYSAYSNSHYYLFDNLGDALVRQATTSPFNLSGTQDLSISLWVRQDSDGSANFILWDLQNAAGATTASTANRFFLQYSSSANRLVVRHRTNSVNYDRQFNLHDNNSATGTGTNPAVKWSSTNRGNVVDGDFCLLTVVYDASQSDATNGLKLYWNATELTTEAVPSADGTRSSSAVNYVSLGNNAHNYTTTAGGFTGAIDEVKIYTSALTSGNVSTIYNSGTIANAANTFSTGLLTEFTFDTNTTDSNSDFPTSTNDDGVRTSWV